MQVKSTTMLENELSGCADYKKFLLDNADAQRTPPLDALLQRSLRASGMRRADVLRRSGLNPVYGYQILSGKRRPGRDTLLCLCLGMRMPAEQTQKLLKMAGYAPLYVKNRRDSAVYHALCHELDAAALNQMLYELGEPVLA